MTYDDLGRVLTETIYQLGVKEHVLTHSHNDEGKSSGFEWRKDEDDIQVAYGYDTSGRMSSITDGELEVTYDYLANTGLIEHIGYLTQSHKDTKKKGREDYQTNLLNQYEAINSTEGDNFV